MKCKSASQGWKLTPLGEVAEFLNGRGFKPHEWKKRGLPIIRIQNLNGSREYNYFDGEYAPKILVEPGDLLFAWSGSKGASFGPHFWREPTKGLLNYHTWRILCGSRLDRQFTYHILRQLTYRIEHTAQGAAGLVHIQKGWIEAWEVALPPLPEQRKIADILTTWDEALTQLDALIEAQERRKKALMQQFLTGKKRFPGFKGKWKKVALGDVAENVADANKGRMGTTSLYGVTKADGVVPMRDHVKGESFDRCKRVKTDWFAYNPMRINIGSIARWQGTETIMVSGDYVVFRCHPNKLLPAYLDHLRQSWMWQFFVTRGGNGSVRIRIYFSDLAEFTFPCPSLEEQRQIATILDTADQQLTLLRTQRTALDQQKRGLMQRLLTGKLRVKP